MPQYFLQYKSEDNLWITIENLQNSTAISTFPRKSSRRCRNSSATTTVSRTRKTQNIKKQEVRSHRSAAETRFTLIIPTNIPLSKMSSRSSSSLRAKFTGTFIPNRKIRETSLNRATSSLHTASAAWNLRKSSTKAWMITSTRTR